MEINKELMQMEEFLGLTIAKIGQRNYTFTAWEKPEHVMQINHSKAHQNAARKFYGKNGTSASTFTSVWAPYRISDVWVRCTECEKINTKR